jgi:hypothetical protein
MRVVHLEIAENRGLKVLSDNDDKLTPDYAVD